LNFISPFLQCTDFTKNIIEYSFYDIYDDGTMQSAKNTIKKILNKLPEDATYDDIIYEIHLNKKIDSALRDVKEGRTYSEEQALKRLEKWLK
jgi:hypothetical protein